ncbi:hypothetical protein FB599_0728 [Herbaspirillum sp. SJZ130]|nr:hypothetical protein FB599_0728 [Herbaspirillum sp. SJZ130]TQK15316.1 hypothetical protein FB598_0666 [Herbaspirillum sp. SJZ106]TWC71214.1 hypothetical protein FB597_101184 [Herbaspirillum sp. SJZ099]
MALARPRPSLAASGRMHAISSAGFGLPRSFIVQALRRELIRIYGLADDCCTAMGVGETGEFLALDGQPDYNAPGFALRLSLADANGRRMQRLLEFEVGILMQQYRVRLGARSFNIAFLPALDRPALATAARAAMQEALRPQAQG